MDDSATMTMTASTSSTHVAYSDETNWNDGRYRTVAVISLTIATSLALGPKLERILYAEFSEAKWKKLNSDRRADAAINALLVLLDAAAKGAIRVDALTWDIEDSRHSVRGRCDVANLGRMNYHAYQHAMTHWPPSAWWIMPDEHEEVDWDTLSDVLASVGGRSSLTMLDGVRRRQHQLIKLTPRSSADSIFVQMADLFAGMAAYSRGSFESYSMWQDSRSGQATLFEQQRPKLSRKDHVRWRLLDRFHNECKRRSLQVSLASSSGLETRNPTMPINFWLWRQQGLYDKAPTRPTRS